MADVEWHGDEILAKIKAAIPDGIEEWCRTRALPASDDKCPVDTGVMRDTHNVERISDEEVAISYGPLAYVLKQYFDDTLRHTVGESHWLEKGIQETQEDLAQIIADRIEAAL
jgi:hypothetical protein